MGVRRAIMAVLGPYHVAHTWHACRSTAPIEYSVRFTLAAARHHNLLRVRTMQCVSCLYHPRTCNHARPPQSRSALGLAVSELLLDISITHARVFG